VSAAEAVSKKATARRQKPAAKAVAKGAASATPQPPRATVEAGVAPNIAGSSLDTILEELRGVKRLVEQFATPPSDSDAGLDASVDSLRRLLSELMEQRMESVIRDLVEVRREAASLAREDGQGIVARLEALLERLGAVRFEAEPLDLVDPLIHVVVDERLQANVPEGVILETLRPGYRTARGLVVSRAAVTVNQRP
jgi:molecular chaperone GrpE (heat shock protein)